MNYHVEEGRRLKEEQTMLQESRAYVECASAEETQHSGNIGWNPGLIPMP